MGKLWRQRDGQAVVEYALIIVLVALVLFFVLKVFGVQLGGSLHNTAVRVGKA